MSLATRLVGLLPLTWVKAAARLQWRHPWLKALFDRVARSIRSDEQMIQRGPGKGLLFFAGESNAGYLLGTTEPHVQQAIAESVRPGMAVYDAGAHIGFFAVIAARLVGDRGSVTCFEPLEGNCDLIRRNAVLNRFSHITVRCEALSDRNGEAAFQTSSVPSWGRLVEAAGHVSQATGEVAVSVRSIDSLLRERTIPPPDLIKVDVEGAETAVLAGARETLAKYHPVLLIELHGTNGPVADILESSGYEAAVLGSREDIRGAAWDAHVIAHSVRRSDKRRIPGR